MKLIVTDMDGTLLDSHGRIPGENIDALRLAEAHGIEIAIATGRMYRNALELCREAGIAPHIISNNGAFIYTKGGSRLHAEPLEEKLARQAVDWLEGNDYLYFANGDLRSLVPPDAAERIRREYADTQNRLPSVTEKTVLGLLHAVEHGVEAADPGTIARSAPGSISALCTSKKKLAEGKAHFCAHRGLTMTAGGNHIFEMTGASVSKGNALTVLARHLGIGLDATMAIGDHHNDLSMFEKAGTSVAMGNAGEEVKRLCSRQTLSNDEFGVARAIERAISEM